MSCTVTDCPKKTVAKGLCAQHYQQVKRTGGTGRTKALDGEATVSVTFHLSEAQNRELAAYAKEKGLSMANVLRSAVKCFLWNAPPKKKAGPSLRSQVLARYRVTR